MEILFTGVWDTDFAELVENSLKEFLPKLSSYKMPGIITVKIHKGMRIAAGRARAKTNQIDLNYRLLRNNKAEIRDTFGHELAHLVEYWNYNRLSHGAVWKRIMIEIGLPPKRTHDLDVSAFRRTVTYTCSCGIERELSIRAHNRIVRGYSQRICLKCKNVLFNKEELTNNSKSIVDAAN
jgi:SprT protein